MIDVIELGVKIEYARNLRGMYQKDIADQIGVNKSTIQRYETGKIKDPKLPVIESIAKAIRVNPSWLIGKCDEMDMPFSNTANNEHDANHRISDEEYINLVLPYRLASQDDKDAVDIIFRKYKKIAPSTGSTAI